jgi:FMN phosphatase YigB (HAD superfamily)
MSNLKKKSKIILFDREDTLNHAEKWLGGGKGADVLSDFREKLWTKYIDRQFLKKRANKYEFFFNELSSLEKISKYIEVWKNREYLLYEEYPLNGDYSVHYGDSAMGIDLGGTNLKLKINIKILK